MSKRTDIRNAIATAIRGQTIVDQNVLTSRYSALMSETFPIILVYTPEEDPELLVPAPAKYNRTLRVAISAIVKANESVDDSLDSLADEIEAAIIRDATFGGLAMGTVMKKIESEIEYVGEMQFGAIHLNFEVQYYQ